MERLHELPWQDDVLDIEGCGEEGRYFLVSESGDSAADAGNQELVLRVLLSKEDELVHVWLDGLHSALHGGNSVGLSLQAHTLPPHGTKAVICQTGCAATMMTCQITAEHKNLIIL